MLERLKEINKKYIFGLACNKVRVKNKTVKGVKLIFITKQIDKPTPSKEFMSRNH